MMNIGDLYVDPADNMIMMYVGRDPNQGYFHGFFCPCANGKTNNVYYYSNYDLKYLEKIDGNQDRNID
jgi:hypothetical protein